MQLHEGDLIYLFTDGYADQFGGKDGKKFKYKQLQQLILEMKDNKMHVQLQVLEKTINNWRGDLEQVDDILIVGIKV
jgi:serine phosphatase RsbU (regulator of sigma subunit)